jgi:protein SCO1/2
VYKQMLAQLVFAMTATLVAVAPSTVHARDMGVGEEEGAANETPKELVDIGIDEKLGSKIDLDLKFRDEAGNVVPLSTYFHRGQPVLLSPAYYNCANLCNYHLNGMTEMMKKLNWTPGKEFQYVVVSFDPKETPALATAKKANYIRHYGRPGAAIGWHFLTGDEASIKALMSQIGFKYQWDKEGKQWAHSSGTQVLTPNGEISRYFNGINFDPQTVRLSMVEASNGVVGTVVDKLILYCFHYDPKASKYTPYAMGVMRTGSILIILVLAAFLAPFWFRQRKAMGVRTRSGVAAEPSEGELQ